MTIAAVIVTFNRLELLKICIDAVRNQSRKPDAIIVVNNDSTDGTEGFLASQPDLIVIKQANLGSSGGQYSGIKYAFDHGYDWIWCMDDDVMPAINCLEEMTNCVGAINNQNAKVFLPHRIQKMSNSQWSYFTEFNFSNPFRSRNPKTITICGNEKIPVRICSFPFEGPLIHRDVVSRAGNVDDSYFIYFDDTDYSIRIHNLGFEMYLVPRSHLIRMLVPKPFSGRSLYYFIRNSIIIDKRYGTGFYFNGRIIVHLLVALKKAINAIRRRQISDIRYISSGVWDALFGVWR